MLEAFLIVLVGVMAAQAAPGPNLIAVASVALSRGRRAGLFVVAGVSCGMLVWSLASAFGLIIVLEIFPHSLTVLRLAGGAYLLWLAFKGLWAAIHNQPGAISPEKRELSDLQAWSQGLLVLLTNPKAVLMWVAVSTYLFGAGLTPIQVLAFGPVGAVSGFVIYGLYAVLFSTGFANRSYARFSRWIELLFSTAFGTLGGRLLFDGMKELK